MPSGRTTTVDAVYTINDPINRARTLHGARLGVVHGDIRRTYAELAERVDRVGALLREFTEPGDRVALWSLNSDLFLELFIGIPGAGRVLVPHNTRWADPELVYATEDAGARVLFCDRDPGGLADLVDRVIRLDTGEYESLLTAASLDANPVDCDVTPDTLAGLFYTGGTTGASKGVMLTHQNLLTVDHFTCQVHRVGCLFLSHSPGGLNCVRHPRTSGKSVKPRILNRAGHVNNDLNC